MARDIKEKVKKKKTGMCNIAMHRYCLSDIIAGFIHIPKCSWMFLILKIRTLELMGVFWNVLEYLISTLLYISPKFWPYQLLMIFLVFCSRELFLINVA